MIARLDPKFLAYRAPARRVIEIVAVGPRDRIYDETLRLVSAERRR